MTNLPPYFPVGSSYSIDVGEGTASGFYTPTAQDPNPGDTLVYSIVGGPDAALFQVGFLGTIAFKTAPDFENPIDANHDNIYNITVQASDGHGGTATLDLTVNVTNIYETPIITSYNGASGPVLINVNEHIPTTTAVATAAATPDTGQTLTYSIDPNVGDASQFNVDPTTGAVTFKTSPDYENPTDVGLPGQGGQDNVYDVAIIATDTHGGTAEQTYKFFVQDNPNDPIDNLPPNLTLGTLSQTVAENTTEVGVPGVSAGAVGSLTYSIVPASYADPASQDASQFTIDPTTGHLTFTNAPDYEHPTDTTLFGTNTYQVEIQVTDGRGLASTPLPLNITVTDVPNDPADNHPPVFTSYGGAPGPIGLGFFENVGGPVTTAIATDPDAGQTVTYSIDPNIGDASQFTVNPQTGDVSFITPPDYQHPTDVGIPGQGGQDNIYNVGVIASDGNGGTAEQSFQINVVDLPPTFTSYGGIDAGPIALSVNENVVGSVAQVTAQDSDGETVTYSIDPSSADASQFTVDSTSGQLSFVTPPNYESPTDVGQNDVYNVGVTATDSTGPGSSVTQNFAISVQNVNEPPTFLEGPTSSAPVMENTSGFFYGGSAIDPEGQTITYSLDPNVGDASQFAINPATGEIKFITPPDFEHPTDVGIPGQGGQDNIYNVSIIANDGNGGISSQQVQITVAEDPNDPNDNQPPVFTSPTNFSVAENTPATTVVDHVTAIDPSTVQTQPLTYTLAADVPDSNLFNINPTTGDLTFKVSPDFENPTDTGHNNVYNPVVRVIGSGGLSTDQILTINVTNVNEPPVFTSPLNLSVAENTTAAGTVTATDPDIGQTLTFALVAGLGDSDLFHINPTTGALAFNTAPNYEVPTDIGGDNVYNPVVQVSDGHGAETLQSFAITVTNVVEPVHNFAGTPGNDVFVGADGNDTISGGAGNDTLSGRDGNDTITGGTGIDTLYGDAGNDTITGNPNSVLHGGTGDDILNVSTAGGGITATPYGVVWGDAGNDTLNGASSDDILLGNAGNDTISGGAGNDIIAAGPGANIVDGGSGTDVMLFAGPKSDYSFTFDKKGALTSITGPDHLVTTVNNIEVYHFEDGTNYQVSKGALVAETASQSATENAYLTAHGATHDWLI